ncbi:hypothetical protein Tco_0036162 [Tanacetum coccineum]
MAIKRVVIIILLLHPDLKLVNSITGKVYALLLSRNGTLLHNISCLPDDIMEPVINCETFKDTWTDLVHANEGPSDSKKNRIMDLNLDLPEKRLSFSQGLRNVNHIQTLDLADIYERFIYKDNLISRRHTESKKALVTAPISSAFFSNSVVQDFQENSDDEVDERTSEEYLRDLDTEFHKRALLTSSKHFIKRNIFSVSKANENT